MLVFSLDYPPNDGGIARLSTEIVRGLAARDYPVRVLSMQYGGETPQIDELVPTKRLTSKRPLCELSALVELFTRARNDICISGIWYPDGLLAQLAGLQNHVVLAHSAELYPPRQKWRQPLWRYLKRMVLENAKVVIANSHFTADFVIQVAPKANVIAVPLAVDQKQFCPQDRTSARAKWMIDDGKIVLCTVSRIQRFKGHETVLEAIAKLPAEVRDRFIYLVGGKGPDLEFLKSRATQLGLDENVRWLGFVADEELPSLYSAADLFVLATRDVPEKRSVEGFGLAFLEAQACGTPVVGTNTGGIPDAISDSDGGWLIEQDDVQDLSDILTRLHTNPEEFRTMGIKARERVERSFTWEHYLDRFMAALAAGGIQLDG